MHSRLDAVTPEATCDTALILLPMSICHTSNSFFLSMWVLHSVG